jgi:hypothetical protein
MSSEDVVLWLKSLDFYASCSGEFTAASYSLRANLCERRP